MNRTFLILIFLSLFSVRSSASHVMGGSLTYEYLGLTGGLYKYRVTLKMYRDGGGINLPGSMPLGVYIQDASDPNNSNKSRYGNALSIPLISSQFIQPPSPGPNCSFTSPVTVEEGTYRLDISVPANTGGYHLIIDECCRNNTIINLNNPGGTGMVFYALIPNTSTVNNSPIFVDPPVPFICVNDTTSILNSVVDPDGDMLVYSFVQPYRGYSQYSQYPLPNPYVFSIPLVTYSSGYNQNSPFGSGGYANISASTGLTQYMSPTLGLFVVAVQISEYRNNVLIGRNRRDLQIIVVNCSSNPSPVLTTNFQTSYTATAGDTLCFSTSFSDSNNDSIYVTASGSIFDNSVTNPAASFSPVNGSGSASGQFCWNTACNQNGVYQFYVKAIDNGCPPKTTNIVYTLVLNKFTTGNINGPPTVCANQTNVSYSVAGTAGSSFQWNINGGNIVSGGNNDTVLVNWGNMGTGTLSVVETNLKGCSDTATKTVTIGGGINVTSSSNVSVICPGDSVNLFASGGATYSWSPPSGLSDPNIANPVASPDTTTAYVVTVTDSSGCNGTDTVIITVYPLSSVSAGNDTTICIGDTAQLIAVAPAASAYIWSPSTGLSSTNIFNPLAFPVSSTTYMVQITDTNGCINSDTVNLTVNPLPVISTSNDTSICFGDTIQIFASGGIIYNWNPATGLSNQNISNPLAFPNTTTDYAVTVTDSNNCSNNDTVKISVSSLPVANAGNDVSICLGDTVQLSASGGTSYNWIPAAGLSNSNISNPLAFPNTTTDYIVTVSDSNSCSDKDTVRVEIWTLPIVFAGNDTAICIGDTAQLIAVAPAASAYLWSPTTGLSSTNIFNPLAFPTSTTTYIIQVTDTNGCINSDTVNLTVNPLPVISISNDTSICFGDTIQIFASGGIIYNWNPATGLSNPNISNPLAFPNITTDYAVTVTDSSSCSNNDTVKISVFFLPVANAGTDVSICLGNTAQLSASGGTLYNWIPAAGLNNPNISNPLAFPNTTTDYIVTVSDSNFCSDKDTVSVEVWALPIVFAGNDTAICIGDTAQLIAVAPAASTYLWSPSTGLSSTNIFNPLAFPTSTTTYIVQVTDTNGCINSDTVNLTVNPLPVIFLSNDTSICFGDTIQINASGGTIYSWNPATGLSNPNISNPLAFPNITTDYAVIVTDSNSCSNKDTVKISVFSLPLVNAGADTAICIFDTIQLNASGAIFYTWNPATALNNSGIANPLANPIATTNYIVTGTDGSNCKNNDTVLVTVHLLPVANAGSDLWICPGSSITLNATGGAIYQWHTSAFLSDSNIFNPVATPPDTIVYVVFVTDSNNCRNSDTVKIDVGPLVPTNAGIDKTICRNDSVLIGGFPLAPAGSTISWQPSLYLNYDTVANPLTSPPSDIVYIVYVSNDTCTGSDTMNVFVNQLPVADAGLDDTLCFGDTTALNASGGIIYQWSPYAGLSDSSIANPFAFPAFTTEYILTVTDINTCKNSDTVIVFVNSLPLVFAGNDTSICIGDTAQLFANAVADDYLWNPTNDLNDANIQNPLAFPDATTEYIVVVTDSNNCKNSDTVIVNVNPLPVIVTSNDTAICIGDTIQIFAGGGAAYVWLPFVYLDNNSISNPLAFPDNTTNFIVEVTDSNSCKAKDSVLITVNYLPVVDAGLDDTICLGGTTMLNASGGIIYQWFPYAGLSDSSIANPFAFPDFTTEYILTVTDSNSCKNSDTVIIFVNPLPLVFAGNDTSICIGDTAQLSAAAVADDYLWNPTNDLNDANIQNPLAFPDATTEYIVVVTDSNNCKNSDTVIVNVNPLPVVVTSNDTAICIGDTIQIFAGGGAAYVWLPFVYLDNNSISNPLAFPDITTNFIVEVTDSNSCKAKDSVLITVNYLPVVDAGLDDTICFGDTTALNASGGIIYQWFPYAGLSDSSIANPFAFPDFTTEYILTVTDSNSCKNSDTVIIFVNPLPLVFAGNDTSICIGDTAQLSAAAVADDYLWNPTNDLSDANIQTPLAYPINTTEYIVVVTDSNNCKNSDTVIVNVNPLPVIVTSNDTAICIGDTIQIFAVGGAAYTWLPFVYLDNNSISNPLAFPDNTTNFIVEVTDSNSCKTKDSVLITVNYLPVVDAGLDDTICFGDSVQLSASASGFADFLWIPTNGLSDETIANPMASPAITIDYIVMATDSNSCENSDTVTVVVNQLPVISVSADTAICTGDTVQLTASAETAITYSWFPTVGLSTPELLTTSAFPATTTDYIFSATDSNLCNNSDTVVVIVYALPVAILGDDEIFICIGDSVQLEASGGDYYEWFPNEGVKFPDIYNPWVSPSSSTTYYVTVKDTNRCFSMDSISVKIASPKPEADFSVSFIPTCDKLVAEFSNMSVFSSGYIWYFGDGDSSFQKNPVHFFDYGKEGTVKLYAQNSLCRDSMEFQYTLSSINDNIHIPMPNVITPNDDGINDCFKPQAAGDFDDCTWYTIYNRWGSVVYQSKGYGDCWDASSRMSNSDVPAGVYYYVLKIKDIYTINGFVQVVKD